MPRTSELPRAMRSILAPSALCLPSPPALASRTGPVDPLVFLGVAMGRLSGSASFLGGKWGEAGIDATSVTYALLRDGRLVGRLRYFEVDWAAGSVDRLGDPGDGTAEILVTLSKGRARYVIEGGAREVLRPLHDGLVATVPVRVRWREAGWAMYALEALMAGQ